MIDMILAHEVSDVNFCESAAKMVTTSESQQHRHRAVSNEHITTVWVPVSQIN